ncbi:MAG: GNAT family N-acetyltransferase [Sphaerochaetaceae bacterium]
MFQFREEPKSSDIAAGRNILHDSGFFNEEEQEVGVSLVVERLEKGPSCGYFFQFMEESGRVAAYTCFGPIPGTRSSYDLYWIATDPALRNRGFGKKVLEATECEIKKRGGSRVYIETSSSALYVPTRSFYTSNGYILEATLADYYAPGDSKLMYVKVL